MTTPPITPPMTPARTVVARSGAALPNMRRLLARLLLIPSSPMFCPGVILHLRGGGFQADLLQQPRNLGGRTNNMPPDRRGQSAGPNNRPRERPNRGA